MNIGIIGSGEMGICLASKLIQMKHTVSIANSRGPASIKNLVEDIGAEAVTIEEVVKDKEVIIISIPTKNVPDLKYLFDKLPKDVVVIDTMNYYPNLRDGFITELDAIGIDSLWIQEQLDFPVVKAFNSILATSLKDMGRNKGDKKRIAISVSADNAIAKDVVFKLVDECGFDPFYIGPIAQSWKQQPGSSIYCRDINLLELKQRVDAMGTNWFDIINDATLKRRRDEALMKTDYQAYLKGLEN